MDDCFVIGDLKIIRGSNGHLVELPTKWRGGRRFETTPTITTEARKMLEDKVFAEYEKLIGEPVTRRKLSCVWSLGGSALYLVLRSENRIQQRGDSGSLENP